MTAFLIYAMVGAFAGLLAGLFGVGGGLVIVPVLVFVFAKLNLTPEHIVHLAVGTSLATIVVTSLSSVYAHHRHGAVLWRVFAGLTPGLMLGALSGAQVADFLPACHLRTVFGVFELSVAVQMALAIKPSPHRTLPGVLGLSGAGVVIGAFSAIVGIGGGTLSVPFLAWCQTRMQNAVATAAAAGLPIALSGAAGFVLAGIDEQGLPAASSGYVYWPAFAGIVAFSILCAPLGARLAHSLPPLHLRRVFAVFLTGLGIHMLFF